MDEPFSAAEEATFRDKLDHSVGVDLLPTGWRWIVQRLPRLLATLDAALADDLGAAWAEAEAALPEDYATFGVTAWRSPVGYRAEVIWWRGTRRRIAAAGGPTPAAALRALTAKLRERP